MTTIDTGTAAGWQRVGARVRHARVLLGHTSRESFAEACNISVRVIADLESGKRHNFSDRVIARLENAVSWPPGTMNQIVDDADFTPPDPAADTGFVYRAPVFNRSPVSVDVPAVERTLAALDAATRKQATAGSADPAEICAAAVALCRPYMQRLVEDNCLPGQQLHPSVRPLYDTFTRVSQEFGQLAKPNRYEQWLAGEISNETSEAEQRRYAARWQDSRRSRRMTGRP